MPKISAAMAARLIYPTDVVSAVIQKVELCKLNHDLEIEQESNIFTDYYNANKQSALVDFEMETGINIETDKTFLSADVDGLWCKCDAVCDDFIIILNIPYGARESGEFKPLSAHTVARAQIEMKITGFNRCMVYRWSPVATEQCIVEFEQFLYDDYETEVRSLLDFTEHAPESYYTLPIATGEYAKKAYSSYMNAKSAMENAIEMMRRFDNHNVCGILVKNGEVDV